MVVCRLLLSMPLIDGCWQSAVGRCWLLVWVISVMLFDDVRCCLLLFADAFVFLSFVSVVMWWFDGWVVVWLFAWRCCLSLCRCC